VKLFTLGKSRREDLVAHRDRMGHQEAEIATLRTEVRDLRELTQHLDADMELMLCAVEELEPGRSTLELAETLHRLVFRRFDLASYFVALVDREQDLLEFVFYHEGGRVRPQPSRSFSGTPGLTGKAIQSGHPLYMRTLEEAETAGASYSEAEKSSGLIPASFYGVPLGPTREPFGLVSFQSFQVDAFPEARRRILNALSELLAMAIFGRMHLRGK